MTQTKSNILSPSCYCQSRQRTFLFIFSIVALLMPFWGCAAKKPPTEQVAAEPAHPSEVPSPEQHMEKGLDSFLRGDFEQAISSWTEASRLYEKEKKPKEQCQALIKISQAYQAVGQYSMALQTLEAALDLAVKSGDRNLEASVLGSLGNLHIATGPVDKSLRYLEKGLAIARELGNSSLSAAILNNLGNLLTTQQRYQEAIAAYSESAALANNAGNSGLAAIALTNSATAAMEAGQYNKGETFLNQALQQTQGLADSNQKAFGLINIGLAYNDLRPQLTSADDHLLNLANDTLNEAVIVAEAINDLRAISYAWGYLGKLYEDEGEYNEALGLTRKAIFAAQQVNAPESLYRWYWQSGRLLKKLGKSDEAIAAYKLAVPVLQSIREEFASCYGKAQASFRKSAGSLYLELVDLLLQRAASMEEGEQYTNYLLEAREAVEVLKVFELRDYFQDDCVGAARFKTTRLDIVSQTAVVVYPILLPDRTEMLASLPTGMKRYSLEVGLEALTREVREFRRKLEKRTTREYLPHAQKLYDWLIRPLEADLAAMTIDTLVFVPDGPLRTIPMAALHDGKQYLISKYALAITPGLSLTDPQPIERQDIKVLVAGLTEATQGFPPLPFVSEELEAIQTLYGGSILLNQDFLVSSLEETLKEQPFNIVHIASHGQFEGEVENTFLLAFDDKVTMDLLAQDVGLFRFREEPLELLTLSACETAAGDDRAALGLAGVAIKTGARSALATLWYINDQASSILVVEFYRLLQDPSVSRADALQRAQLKMLEDRRYAHPGYWSPFILINNWL